MGPTSIVRDSAAFVTPLYAIDLDRWDREADSIAAMHQSAGLGWRPSTSWAGLPGIAASVRRRGGRGVTVAAVLDALSARSAGADQVTLAIPPVVAGQIAIFAQLVRTTGMSVVCDHFAQAECLSRCCEREAAVVEVLIRVDVGRDRLGVRPGPDLTDLAQGIGRLSGVRLEGLWVGGLPRASGVAALQPADLGRLLDRCRDSFRRAGRQARTISVGRLDDLNDAAGLGITETRMPLLSEGNVCVVAGVVGRPTREQALLDAGEPLLGRSAVVAGPSGGDVTFVAEEFSVLRLPPERCDLTIGDLVFLNPEAPPRPHTGVDVLVCRDRTWSVSPIH